MPTALGTFVLTVALLVPSVTDAGGYGSYIVVEPPQPEPRTFASDRGRHRVYLNRGGAIVAGSSRDNSTTDESSILSGRNVVPPLSASEQEWDELRDCIEDLFDDFAIDFTKLDPGEEPHVEVLFGGSSSDMTFRSGNNVDGAQGVAPLAKDCSVLDRAIAFVFTEELQLGSALDVQRTCDVAAQEIAHAFGLDHAYNAADLMSYLPPANAQATKVFVNEDMPCGEWAVRECQCASNNGKQTQNSYRRLADALGIEGRPLGGTGDLVGGCSARGDDDAALFLSVLILLMAVIRRTQGHVVR